MKRILSPSFVKATLPPHGAQRRSRIAKQPPKRSVGGDAEGVVLERREQDPMKRLATFDTRSLRMRPHG